MFSPAAVLNTKTICNRCGDEIHPDDEIQEGLCSLCYGEGVTCQRCQKLIDFEEREIFVQTGYCPLCIHRKDD
jgi:hypothetical protein